MKKILLLSLIIAMVACNKPFNDPEGHFQGVWTGTFTGGGDSGTFKLQINAQNIVTGSAVSLINPQTYLLEGTITDSGALQATFGNTSSGGSFTGMLNNNIALGTWINKATTPNYNGTWQGTKQ